MKKITTALTIILGSSLFSANAAVTAQSGLFITGGLGVGVLKTGLLTEPEEGTQSNNQDVAWTTGLGYQQALNQNFSLGLEVGYGQLGRAYSDDGNGDDGIIEDIKNTAWHFIANGTYLWSNGLNVSVDAGGVTVTQTEDQTIFGTPYDYSYTGTRFAGGLGIGYQFTQHFGTKLTWMRVFGYSNTDSEFDGSMIMTSDDYLLNLYYTF